MLVGAICVVILGAYTRLADAGLGCPDWPTCYGHLWVPDTVTEIEIANVNFTDTPVEMDKTWPEQTHRIFASSLGLLVLASFYMLNKRYAHVLGLRKANILVTLLAALVGATVLRIIVGQIVEPLLGLLVLAYFVALALRHRACKRSGTEQPVRHAYFLAATLCGLVVVQGLFGMWTVTLKLWPQVVTAHLLGGFLTLTLVSWLFVEIWELRFRVATSNSAVRRLAATALVCVFLQILLGGWTSSNYAALACPDFPTCQNQWLPEMDMVGGFDIFQDVGPNYLGGQLDNLSRVAIHYSHRVGAFIVMALVLALALALMRGGNKRLGAALVLLLTTQLLLGVSNVVFALPLAVAVVHNAGGAALLIFLTLLNVQLRQTSTKTQL